LPEGDDDRAEETIIIPPQANSGRGDDDLIADSFEFVPMPKRADEDAEARENTEAGPEATEENKPNKKKRKGTKPETDPDDIPF